MKNPQVFHFDFISNHANCYGFRALGVEGAGVGVHGVIKLKAGGLKELKIACS
jgi:hypothetical protein